MRILFGWLLFLLYGLSPVQAQTWEMRVCADPDRLPYSNQQQQGFDNKIAEILAKELGAKLTYVWWGQGRTMVDRQLREGHCDVMMGVSDGYLGTVSSIAYYQSSFVFVYRSNSPYKIESFDDEVFKKLRIGIETPGIPPFESLTNRGLSPKAKIIDPISFGKTPISSPLVEAVAQNQIDVAILWGPVGAYFAKQQNTKLTVVPVSPEFEPPALLMVYSITLAVRAGDEVFRDRLNAAIAKRWDQIQAVLQSYAVPQIPLPKPVLEVK